MKVKYFNSCAAKKRLEIVESYVEGKGASKPIEELIGQNSEDSGIKVETFQDDGKQKTLTLALDLSRVSAVGELFKSPYDLWESYSG